MMGVYELFRGRSNPQDVLEVIDQGNASVGAQRPFPTNLYLGLSGRWPNRGGISLFPDFTKSLAR
jgi:hypothetical protein